MRTTWESALPKNKINYSFWLKSVIDDNYLSNYKYNFMTCKSRSFR